MAPRRRQRFVVLGALALFAAAAACEPIPQQPPPPAKKPAPKKSSPTTTTTTLPPSFCNAPIVDDAGKTQYVAIVGDGNGGAPDAVTFTAATEAEVQAEVAEIEATEGEVVAVEPDFPVTAMDHDPDADPRLGEPGWWGVGAAGFPAAWANAGSLGENTTIAVLDTGVRASHEDLNGGVDIGVDHVVDINGVPGGTTDPSTGTSAGHGTHVAGIAGARHNLVGGVGAAPGVTIYPVRVLNSSGSGSYATIINGISSARTAGADVISMSLGGGQPLPATEAALQSAITAATDAGIVVVAAAGNSGTCNALYPAVLDGVIAVASTNSPGTTLSSFSERGPDVDIAAPGGAVFSTLNGSDVQYGGKSGTSMATPFVSAAAALLLACGVPSAQVESLLESTSTPIAGNPIQTSPIVSGALDAAAATGNCPPP
jgi:subtilisin family serine protease